MAKQCLYCQCSISVILLNSFLLSSVTNERGCSKLIADLGNTINTCCNIMCTVTPRWTHAVTFAEKRKCKDHQLQHTLSTSQNHHIYMPWALFSITKSKIAGKCGRYSNSVFLFFTHYVHPCGVIETSVKKTIQKCYAARKENNILSWKRKWKELECPNLATMWEYMWKIAELV